CVILVVLGFAISAGQGTILLLASPDGSIPGWGGTPIEQLFWYALGGALLVVVPFGIPVLAIALFAWRLIVRTIGRPRLSAFLEATVIVVAAAVLIPRASLRMSCFGSVCR